jgi:TatD DNase family protein
MMDGPFVDSHCHVDLFTSPAEIVTEAETRKVYTIAVTNAPSVFRHTADLTKGCRYVRAAVGLHPELVHSHGHQVELLQALLGETRYVGEVGLDYSTSNQTIRRKQREVLERILAWCAEYGNKVITLHSRRAAADTIAALGKSYPGRLILHWFTGNIRDLELAASYDMYFSVNPAMVQSKKGQALISRIPLNRVLTETDGPFVRLHSRPAGPSDIEQVLRGLSTLWSVPPEEVRDIVLSNFRTLLAEP